MSDSQNPQPERAELGKEAVLAEAGQDSSREPRQEPDQEPEGAKTGRTKLKPSQYLWALGGFASFGLGAVGVVIPVLPTTPFILLAAFCFMRSSERLNEWFRHTKLYRQVFEGWVNRRTMTIKAKLSVLVPVTVLMGLAFAFMGAIPIGRVILAIVWAAHVIYFGFIVRTDRSGGGDPEGE